MRSRVALLVALADKIFGRRLHWLVHVTRMNDDHDCPSDHHMGQSITGMIRLGSKLGEI